MRFFNIKIAVMMLSAVFFVGLDRAIKVFSLSHPGNFQVIGDILKFDPIENKNIAFSLPLNGVWLEVMIAAIIIFLLFIFVDSIKKQTLVKACFLLIIILGAASNLHDRIVFGAVIDYLDLKYFTVFNLADVMIVTGAIGTVFMLFNEDKKNL
jgi:signal peptidase II